MRGQELNLHNSDPEINLSFSTARWVRHFCTVWQDSPHSRLTLDVEVLGVALAVALFVGGDAGIEARLTPPHVLQHQRPVPDEHAARHVLPNRLAL